jgi:hypothetical protein
MELSTKMLWCAGRAFLWYVKPKHEVWCQHFRRNKHMNLAKREDLPKFESEKPLRVLHT